MKIRIAEDISNSLNDVMFNYQYKSGIAIDAIDNDIKKRQEIKERRRILKQRRKETKN
ncbi:hypothetical protein J6Y73_00095 [bacterium]|nr:hypothetical protein [bacterium]